MNNRYDRQRPVTGQEADEARALHALGRLLHADAAASIAVRGLADALRRGFERCEGPRLGAVAVSGPLCKGWKS